ncbi:hypothetical protein HEQ60_07895 [Haematospirillum sp. H1815]|uniref:ABC transporter substrate-binding protein n=1 Tax=Haematospirillum sp. H1815 TaxID=2723108 RepID=UPI00143A722C|nr:ABC transporter substrate binding protein [Haematospirillum sp. H1815]NKD77679.1 hypothetical protein [Haematospirillum sp. H1815]
MARWHRTLAAALSAWLLAPAFGGAFASEHHILMLLWRGETAVESAWRDRMNHSGIPHQVTVLSAEQDRGRLVDGLRKLRSQFDGGQIRLIYCSESMACMVAKQVVRGDVPIVFANVMDPVGTGVANSLVVPGLGTGGVKGGVAVGEQLSVLRGLVRFNSLLFLYNPREYNSILSRNAVMDWAEKEGIRVEERRVVPGSISLDEVISDLFIGKLAADVLFVSDDSYVTSRGQEIAETVGERIILLAGRHELVRAGWVAAWAPDEAEIGRMAADLTLDVLSKGIDPGLEEVRMPKPQLFFDAAAAKRHNIVFPTGVPGPGGVTEKAVP